MKGLNGRILACLIGLATSLLLLEAAIRCVAAVRAFTRDWPESWEFSPDQPTILCLGDSFTEGFGAPMDQGYPAQLQRMFSQRQPRLRVKVLNQGFGGYNTYQIRERLDYCLRREVQTAVVLLAGGNNSFNAAGYTRAGKARWRDWLAKSRAMRFLLLMKEASQDASQGLSDGERGLFPSEVFRCIAEGYEQEERGNDRQALQWFESGAERYPQNAISYYAASRLYAKLGNSAAARQWEQRARRLHPPFSPKEQEYIRWAAMLVK